MTTCVCSQENYIAESENDVIVSLSNNFARNWTVAVSGQTSLDISSGTFGVKFPLTFLKDLSPKAWIWFVLEYSDS